MKRLKFYGLGGQGVVTAGKVLSSAVSLHEDKYAITVPAYGHERRGAPVFTDVVMDEKPVLVNCFVYTPDIVVVMDETIIQKHVDVAQGITRPARLWQGSIRRHFRSGPFIMSMRPRWHWTI